MTAMETFVGSSPQILGRLHNHVFNAPLEYVVCTETSKIWFGNIFEWILQKSSQNVSLSVPIISNVCWKGLITFVYLQILVRVSHDWVRAFTIMRSWKYWDHLKIVLSEISLMFYGILLPRFNDGLELILKRDTVRILLNKNFKTSHC